MRESETITNNMHFWAYVDFMRQNERWRHSKMSVIVIQTNTNIQQSFHLTLCLTHTERTHARLSYYLPVIKSTCCCMHSVSISGFIIMNALAVYRILCICVIDNSQHCVTLQCPNKQHSVQCTCIKLIREWISHSCFEYNRYNRWTEGYANALETTFVNECSFSVIDTLSKFQINSRWFNGNALLSGTSFFRNDNSSMRFEWTFWIQLLHTIFTMPWWWIYGTSKMLFKFLCWFNCTIHFTSLTVAQFSKKKDKRIMWQTLATACIQNVTRLIKLWVYHSMNLEFLNIMRWLVVVHKHIIQCLCTWDKSNIINHALCTLLHFISNLD